MEINWVSLSIEALFSTALEGVAFAIIAYWVVLKGRRALREGRLDDTVIFSFNFVDTSGEAPRLAFRTPLSGTMKEIFQSEALIQAIKEAGDRATETSPVIQLKTPAQHRMMQRLLVNFCNQLNLEGQRRLLVGEPCEERVLKLALIFEPGAESKLFRIISVSDVLWRSLDTHREALTFTFPYHADRLSALDAIRRQDSTDAALPPMEQVLATFHLALPA